MHDMLAICSLGITLFVQLYHLWYLSKIQLAKKNAQTF